MSIEISGAKRVALVTGTGSGIGAAMAHAFTYAGYAVNFVVNRLAAFERGSQANGGTALTTMVDVRDSASVSALVRAGMMQVGAFDIVCPNTSIMRVEAPLQETTGDGVETLLTVNATGAIYTLRAALPHVRTGGAVIVTSSVSGPQAHPNAAVYAATTIASLGLKVASRSIRVHAVCLSGVDMPLTRGAYGTDVATTLAQCAAANPMGRITTPEDIAQAVLFLVSPAARHSNGVALRVDGGDGRRGAL